MTNADTTTSTSAAAAPAVTANLSGWVVACPDCRLSGGPFGADKARLLAGEHDRLHHGGRLTAHVTDQHWCESCRTRLAVTTWTPTAAMPGEAGAVPFALCRHCAPEPTAPASTTPGAGSAGDR